MEEEKKPGQKPEFSKRILIAAMLVNILVIAFTCLMVWRTMDLTPLAYLIPSVGAEVTAGTASYYFKAKAENKIKLAKAYGIEITEHILNEY